MFVIDDTSTVQETPSNNGQQKMRGFLKGTSSEIKRPLSTSNRRASLNSSSRKLRSRARSEGQLKNLGKRDTSGSMECLRPTSALEREIDTKPGDSSFEYDYADIDNSFTKFLQVCFSQISAVDLC